MTEATRPQGKVLIAGNSTFVTKENIRENLSKSQWLPRIGTLVVADANKTLVSAVHELAKDYSMNVEVVQLQWQMEDPITKETKTNKGAIFEMYQKYIPRVNASMAFTTGEDKAAAVLEREAGKVKHPFIAVPIEPEQLPDIMSLATPLLDTEDAARVKEKFPSANGPESR